MLLFIIKTIVCFGIMYCATRFYGNVSDNLLVKAFLCLVIMFATYWVDVYRFSSIFFKSPDVIWLTILSISSAFKKSVPIFSTHV